MGVNYVSKIYTQDRLFFIKLLFRWSGSIWQLLWLDFLVFVAVYVSLAAIYQIVLYEDPRAKATFEVTVSWLKSIRTSVPLSFMLGFFVSSVVERWWSVCLTIPWLASSSFYCQALLNSPKLSRSDLARKLRITVLRYMNLSWILMMAGISLHIKDRFGYWMPSKKKYKLTWKRRLRMINADKKAHKYFGKMITDNEIAAFGRSAALSNENRHSYQPEYWLPLVWATRLIRRARNLDCIADERQCLWLMQQVQKFRYDLGTVWMYSEFNFPLVYTQVVVTAVYLFLISTVVSTQLMDTDIVQSSSITLSVNGTFTRSTEHQVLAFIPIIGGLEFIFYLGWFKIGMSLLNPMGKDKADIPMSEILDSNMKTSVKMGGAEDSLLPRGLTDTGEPEEAQVAQFLGSFDFSKVRAHDKFDSAAVTEGNLSRALLKRLKHRHHHGNGKQSGGISGSSTGGTLSPGSGHSSAAASERSSMRLHHHRHRDQAKSGSSSNQLTVDSATSATCNISSLGGPRRMSIAAAARQAVSDRNGRTQQQQLRPAEEPAVSVINFRRPAANINS